MRVDRKCVFKASADATATVLRFSGSLTWMESLLLALLLEDVRARSGPATVAHFFLGRDSLSSEGFSAFEL
jgi:hypothetical protein